MPRKIPPRLPKSRDVDALCKFLAPAPKELRPLLLRMKEKLNPGITRKLLNVSSTTLETWCRGCQKPGASESRLIWLVYCSLFEPEKVESVFHILTWGRFATDRKCQMLRRERTARGRFASEKPPLVASNDVKTGGSVSITEHKSASHW